MDFHGLTRRGLQSLCKLNKIPANMTNLAMADALAALPKVEGIEDFIEADKSDDPQKTVTQSPKTAYRTANRSKASNNVEPENSQQRQPMTSTRRMTRRALAEGAVADQGKENINLPETPAVQSRCRRPVSTRKMIETQAVENEVIEKLLDQEKSGVLETPAATACRRRGAAASSRRKTDAQKEEKSVHRAYSTRRSVRLLEKSMEELSLKEKGSVEDITTDVSEEKKDASGADSLKASEENLEGENDSEAGSSQQNSAKKLQNENVETEMGYNMEKASGSSEKNIDKIDISEESELPQIENAEKDENANNVLADENGSAVMTSEDFETADPSLLSEAEKNISNDLLIGSESNYGVELLSEASDESIINASQLLQPHDVSCLDTKQECLLPEDSLISETSDFVEIHRMNSAEEGNLSNSIQEKDNSVTATEKVCPEGVCCEELDVGDEEVIACAVAFPSPAIESPNQLSTTNSVMAFKNMPIEINPESLIEVEVVEDEEFNFVVGNFQEYSNMNEAPEPIAQEQIDLEDLVDVNVNQVKELQVKQSCPFEGQVSSVNISGETTLSQFPGNTIPRQFLRSTGQTPAQSATNPESLIEVDVVEDEEFDFVVGNFQEHSNLNEAPKNVAQEHVNLEDLVDVNVNQVEEFQVKQSYPFEGQVSSVNIAGETNLFQFPRNTIQGQFPRPSCQTPAKSATKKQMTAAKDTIQALGIDKENIDNSGMKVAGVNKVKKNVTDMEVYEKMSMRQLTKMVKEKLQISNKNNEDKNLSKLEKRRVALLELPENCITGAADAEPQSNNNN